MRWTTLTPATSWVTIRTFTKWKPWGTERDQVRHVKIAVIFICPWNEAADLSGRPVIWNRCSHPFSGHGRIHVPRNYFCVRGIHVSPPCRDIVDPTMNLVLLHNKLITIHLWNRWLWIRFLRRERRFGCTVTVVCALIPFQMASQLRPCPWITRKISVHILEF